MKVTVVPIVNGKLGTISRDLLRRLEVLEIKVRDVNIQTPALMKSAMILRRELET